MLCKLLIFSLIVSCDNTNNHKEVKTLSSVSSIENITCFPQIISYHFGVESLAPSTQIEVLSLLGMNGFITQIETNNDLEKLDQFYNSRELSNGVFNVNNIFTTISIDDLNENQEKIIIIDKIFKKISDKNTELLVLFEGNKNNVQGVENSINKLTSLAKKYNKSIIIYPHDDLAIETAEEALSYIEKVNADNLFLSIHLCHELAAGNGERIQEVVKNVISFTRFVSVSGATISEKNNNLLPLWFWGIKPLNMGDYDYTKFLLTLFEYNYFRVIAIHTWGVSNNFNLTIEEHLPQSKKIVDNILENFCN